MRPPQQLWPPAPPPQPLLTAPASGLPCLPLLQHYADVRPRIKGRFVSPEEFAAWQEAKVRVYFSTVALSPL